MPNKTPKKYHPATKEIFELMDKGLSSEQAHSLVKPDNEISKHGLRAIEKNYRHYSLTRPECVEKASNAVLDTVDMKSIKRNNKVITPSVSERLTAAKMILDRAEPVVNKNLNVNANLDLSPVDLDKYRNQDQ